MPVFKFLHTTKISPGQTAGEMTGILCRLGADAIQQDVEDGEVSGIRFRVCIDDEYVAYKLPIRSKPIYDLYKKEFENKRRRRALSDSERARSLARLQDQAKRTAWRIVLEWLKIQLAFVETGARSTLEVFMADMIVPGSDETVGELVVERGLTALLPAPKEWDAKQATLAEGETT